MTEANQPISPVSSEHYKNILGLTKREYFAAIAMQGMLSKMEDALKREQQFIDNVAIKAVRYSDALINALNKENGK
jgi:hypothetical protein